MIQSTSEKPSGSLELHIYNGRVINSFTWYEDDGTTYDYEKGIFYKRVIGFDPNNKTISFSKKEGDFSSKFTSIQIHLHGFSELSKIMVNGKEYKIAMNSKGNMFTEFPLSNDEISIKY